MRGKGVNRLYENIGEILLTSYNNEVFSAASVAASKAADGSIQNWFAAIGRYGENDGIEVDETSLFDLASLTKPLATLPSILHLIDRGEIDWNETLESLLERNVEEPFRSIKLHHLLAHSSGLPAHEPYWQALKSIEKERKKEWLIGEIITGIPRYVPGSRHVYSDLGYFLLGAVVEIKSKIRLDEYWRTCIAHPLKVEDELFFPAYVKQERARQYVSTGVCRWSGRELTGLVHDDNCRALGGVGGHAGLFGSSAAVLTVCTEFLRLYHGRRSRLPISPRTFKKACERVDDSEWTCGFNLPSLSGSSSGRFFSPNSLGHLGYTGVSFWIDVDNPLIVCLLTNRVIKGEDRAGISALRPRIHDAIAACLRTNPRNP